MLLSLSSHPDFDKILEKYIAPKDLPTVRDTVFTLKTKVLLFNTHRRYYIPGALAKGHTGILTGDRCLCFQGLGEMPQETQSARGRRSLPGSGTVRASSLTREPLNQTTR